ncbi:MAG: hypothetical protein JEY94_05345 [Melioribacteraceae bacterium]|nr:hypothetical protein [Melioribacteraceae bacterium]
MKKLFGLSVIMILTSLFLFNCEDSGLEPEPNPGRRDYVWEVDTLVIPYTFLHEIWGSSPDDVWAIGPGGDLDKTIYHYNGKKWNNVGMQRPISPKGIWGFSSDDIWIAGNEGKIAHYNGTEWYRHLVLDEEKFAYSAFEDIWGENNQNIWAVGYLDSANTRKGLVYHFDGKEWKRINIVHNNGNLGKIRKGKKTSNNYYLWGLLENDFIGDSTMILEYSGQPNMKVLDKSRFVFGEWHNMEVIEDEVIFTINNSLYTYKNNEFNLITTNNFSDAYQGIFGRTKKDIFWLMDNGITHYNGNNIEYILEFHGTEHLVRGLLFENDVFSLAKDYSNYTNIIIKGKLKN